MWLRKPLTTESRLAAVLPDQAVLPAAPELGFPDLESSLQLRDWGIEKMQRWIMPAAVMLLMLTGCGSRSIQGSYLARDGHSVAFLQLTENRSQQIMGTMTLVQLSADGRAERSELGITAGSVDVNGHTLVLPIKGANILAQKRNVMGELSRNGLELAMPGGTLHFASAKSQDFDAAVNELAEAGRQQQRLRAQAELVAANVNRVAHLTQTLAAYNTRVQSSTGGPEAARKQEEQLVAAAQKDLAIMQNLASKHQDYSAGQVGFRIGQLTFQMGQIKFGVEQTVQQGRKHLAQFDEALTKSPCNASPKLQGCDALEQEKARYAITRAKVEGEIAQLSANLRTNEMAIDAINKQAGN